MWKEGARGGDVENNSVYTRKMNVETLANTMIDLPTSTAQQRRQQRQQKRKQIDNNFSCMIQP